MASPDTIYAEVCEDIRQVRIYELTSAKWYTALLVAIAGVIVTFKFGTPDNAGSFQYALANSFPIQLLLCTTITGIALFASFTIIFAHRYHRKLERYLDANLFPSEIPSRMNAIPRTRVLPSHFIIATQLLVAAATDAIILL